MQLNQLTLVCASGSRRSATIAAWANHLTKNYDHLAGLVIANAALYQDKVEREASLRIERLWKCKKALGERYHSEVEMFGGSKSTIHPRMGIILLSLGINEVLDQRVQVVSKQLLEDSSLVLVAEDCMKGEILRRTHYLGQIYTVKEFVGYKKEYHNLKDRHAWGTTGRKLRKDLEFCMDLRQYATGILVRI